ncbi:MAG: SdrD B-like domain-containing protein [Caldilineaceae bacterium]
MNLPRSFNRLVPSWRKLHKALTICVLASLLAGLIPPPLVTAIAPTALASVAATVADQLSAAPVAKAASSAAPAHAPALSTILPAPLHHWAFDEGSGSTVADNGSSPQAGTVNGAIDWLGAGATSVTGGAVEFTGDEYVQFGLSALAAPWTVGVWVYRTSDDVDGAYLIRDNTNFGDALVLESSTDQVAYQDGSFGAVDLAYTVPLNTWTYLTFVGNSTNTLLYADGEFVGSTGNVNDYNLGLYYLSSPATGSPSPAAARMSNARVDDLRVYDSALTPVEVYTLYNSFTAALSCTATEVGGMVYREMELNGIADPPVYDIDSVPNFASLGLEVRKTRYAEVGQSGVTVTVYDNGNTMIGSTTTAADGSWKVDASTAADAALRVEFGLPDGQESGPSGVDNHSSVVFTTRGACNVNFTGGRPQDHCQDNPYCAASHFPSTSSSNTWHSISDFPFDSGIGVVPNSATDSHIDWGATTGFNFYPAAPQRTVATSDVVATALGLAWDKHQSRLFAGAYHRNAAPLHTNSSSNGHAEGAIYQIPYVADAPGTPSLWLDLETLFGDGFAGIYTTTNESNTIGWTGLGDLEMANDGSQLYLVNLDAVEVLVIPISADGAAPTNVADIKRFPFPTDACPTGTWSWGKPYQAALGLGVNPYTGEVYASLTCNGPTASDLKGIIYSFDPNDATPTATDMVKQIEWSLNSKRPAQAASGTGYGSQVILPWASVQASSSQPQEAQPWLGSIEFDVRADGSYGMIVGERNRGHDMVVNSGHPSGGALYKFCNSGTATNPSWTMEANGVCGAETSTVPYTTASASTAGSNTETFNRFFKYIGQNGANSMGLLDTAPGFVELVSLGSNNISNNMQSGLMWHNMATGDRTRDNKLQGSYAPVLEAPHAKGNAYGDVELLCDQAPLQVGNRVWNDANGDGIQGAGEAGIGNVTVELLHNGQVLSSTTTSSDGSYYFNLTTISPTLATAVGTQWLVRTQWAVGTLDHLNITLQNADASPNGDARDADGDNNVGQPAATTTSAVSLPLEVPAPMIISMTLVTRLNTPFPRKHRSRQEQHRRRRHLRLQQR